MGILRRRCGFPRWTVEARWAKERTRRGVGGIADGRRFGWEFYGGAGDSHAGRFRRRGRRSARGAREGVGGPRGGPHGAGGEVAGGAVGEGLGSDRSLRPGGGWHGRRYRAWRTGRAPVWGKRRRRSSLRYRWKDRGTGSGPGREIG